jgi:hypothetical protein
MLPPCVLWIDPGFMSGFARLERGRFLADEYPFKEAGDRLYALAQHYGPAMWVGWERFTVNAETHKKTPQPEAMEFIGVARFFCLSWRCRILTPAAPGDRNTATQAMLRQLGWWVPGKDDAQSAAQHMLSWLLRTGQLPPAERARILTGR